MMRAPVVDTQPPLPQTNGPANQNILLAWRTRSKTCSCSTETMSDTQAKVAASPRSWGKFLARLLYVLLLAVLIGWVLKRVSVTINESARPAGFAQGLVQGAMMPCALPNLLVGIDVPIYAQNNTGLSYKLGYTVGVNGCGAIFFGIFFWRLNRWKKRNDAPA
jgi:hypothetical protein